MFSWLFRLSLSFSWLGGDLNFFQYPRLEWDQLQSNLIAFVPRAKRAPLHGRPIESRFKDKQGSNRIALQLILDYETSMLSTMTLPRADSHLVTLRGTATRCSFQDPLPFIKVRSNGPRGVYSDYWLSFNRGQETQTREVGPTPDTIIEKDLLYLYPFR